MQRTKPTLATMLFICLSVPLVGCGGGGSSTPDPAAGLAPLVLSSANAGSASTVAMGYGAVALGLGQLAVDWLDAADLAGAGAITTACVGGGTQSLQLLDRDGDGRVSAGDQLVVTLTTCNLKPLEDVYDGSLTIDVAAPSASIQRAGSISFGPRFDPPYAGVSVRIVGGLKFEYGSDRLSKSIRVFSAAQSFGVTASSGGKSLNEVITRLDARREIRRDTARTSTTIGYHVSSDALGGSIDVTTSTPWGSWFDRYPDTGVLTIVGAANGTALLRASQVGGSQWELLLGGVATATVAAGDASTGYLWSGAGWLVGDSRYMTYPIQAPAISDFRTLEQPSVTVIAPNPPPLVWAYSRPLAAGTLVGAKFVRNSIGPGDSWAVPEIDAVLRIEGALLTVTPATQLEPGNGYLLVFDANYVQPITDTDGATTDRPSLSVSVAQTITASARLQSPGMLFGSGSTLVLDASASLAAGSAVSATQWRQISGPVLTFTGANSALASVTPTTVENGLAVVEVQVSNAAGEIDRQQLSFQVVGDASHALVLGYRVGNQAMSVTTSPLNSSSAYVRYFPDLNVLDVYSAGGRILASLPSGTPWQTGTDMTSGVNGAVVVWIAGLGAICNADGTHIVILDYALDGTGAMTRLALDFEAPCNAPATTFGSVRFNSTIPLRQ